MNWRASPSVVALWLKGRGAHRWGPLRGRSGFVGRERGSCALVPGPSVCIALPLSYVYILHAPWRFFPELGV